MKFGGTSVGTPENIKKVIAIVSKTKQPVLVVVSAYTKVTDQLIEMANCAVSGKEYISLFEKVSIRHVEAIKELIADSSRLQKTEKAVQKTLQELKKILTGVELIKELSPKTLDLIMSFGERLSAYTISQAFIDFGVDAEYVDTRTLIRTDNSFGRAKVDVVQTEKNLRACMKKYPKKLKILTGFIAATKNKETTTLGRGGSDYTASVVGAALAAKAIEIWTDVDGVLTADPRRVKSAFSIPSMNYKEAMEMSHFGAKVIYSPTMIPAFKKHIPLVIKNTFNPDFPGTIISNTTSNGYSIKGISSISDISLILVQGAGMVGVPGVAARLFGALAHAAVSVILITQASSEHTICIAVDASSAPRAEEALTEEFKSEVRDHTIDEIFVEKNLSIIAVVGEQMKKKSGVAGSVFGALGKSGVSVIAIAQGSSERNISLVVAKKDEEIALQTIHQAFFNK